MGSEKLLIKKEFLPTRCEICHQSDQFDPVNNTCGRCQRITLAYNSQPLVLEELQVATPRPVFLRSGYNGLPIAFLLLVICLFLCAYIGSLGSFFLVVAIFSSSMLPLWKIAVHRWLTTYGEVLRGQITEVRSLPSGYFEVHFTSNESGQEQISGICHITGTEWNNSRLKQPEGILPRSGQPITILYTKKYPLKPIVYEFSLYQVDVPRREE